MKIHRRARQRLLQSFGRWVESSITQAAELADKREKVEEVQDAAWHFAQLPTRADLRRLHRQLDGLEGAIDGLERAVDAAGLRRAADPQP